MNNLKFLEKIDCLHNAESFLRCLEHLQTDLIMVQLNSTNEIPKKSQCLRCYLIENKNEKVRLELYSIFNYVNTMITYHHQRYEQSSKFYEFDTFFKQISIQIISELQQDGQMFNRNILTEEDLRIPSPVNQLAKKVIDQMIEFSAKNRSLFQENQSSQNIIPSLFGKNDEMSILDLMGSFSDLQLREIDQDPSLIIKRIKTNNRLSLSDQFCSILSRYLTQYLQILRISRQDMEGCLTYEEIQILNEIMQIVKRSDLKDVQNQTKFEFGWSIIYNCVRKTVESTSNYIGSFQSRTSDNHTILRVDSRQSSIPENLKGNESFPEKKFEEEPESNSYISQLFVSLPKRLYSIKGIADSLSMCKDLNSLTLHFKQYKFDKNEVSQLKNEILKCQKITSLSLDFGELDLNTQNIFFDIIFNCSCLQFLQLNLVSQDKIRKQFDDILVKVFSTIQKCKQLTSLELIFFLSSSNHCEDSSELANIILNTSKLSNLKLRIESSNNIYEKLIRVSEAISQSNSLKHLDFQIISELRDNEERNILKSLGKSKRMLSLRFSIICYYFYSYRNQSIMHPFLKIPKLISANISLSCGIKIAN